MVLQRISERLHCRHNAKLLGWVACGGSTALEILREQNGNTDFRGH